MADDQDIVKCPFCRDLLDKKQLSTHIRQAHKDAVSLNFYVDTAAQTLPCPTLNNQKAFGCPFGRIASCKFSAGPLKLFIHIQDDHKVIPLYYREVAGCPLHPLDFLDREPREKSEEPLRLPPPPPSPDPVQPGTVAHLKPSSLVVVDLATLPMAFNTYVRSRQPGKGVTSSEILDFFKMVPDLVRGLGSSPPSTGRDGLPSPPQSSPKHSRTHRVDAPPSPNSPLRRIAVPRDRATFSESPRLSLRRTKSSSQQPSPQVAPSAPQAASSAPQPASSAPQPASSAPQPAPSPPAPIPLEIYDPTRTNDQGKSYLLPNGTTVEYRKLQAAGWIRFAKIPLDSIKKYSFNGEKGPRAVLKRVALLQNDFVGVCIYHTVMNQGRCGRDAYHCSGPMSGEYSNYYVHFRQVMKTPPNTCVFCYCPFSKEWGPTFNHPVAKIMKGYRCDGREKYQDLYRGLVYIIFRCSPLRRAIFKWLGDATIADKFGFTPLVNYFVIVWAFLEMHEAKLLPQGPMEFDERPSLFSVAQHA
ncbi:hypothetical protein BDP27DRAFT_1345956 [Rhodocollybia butyracea]|uniref:Uncharacterized protein n=1 Tax=Rhodocollybia butyracea TaxID=206335 RepID=A0A9P5P709_9AGAR|nr:hypothetical protein BDP27DRAFT_1345956 [Rhodocollybia butyracea]